jgi:hypothetical protein
MKMGKTKAGLLAGTKAIGTGALYAGAPLAIGAGVVGAKGGSELLSGGQKAADEMDF